ncbi:MAG: DUF4395 domain-containing protein [Acidimicrobiia bacterium]|nr:DUF4395 domain-containing protein [Acidimicrobiia bacterium]
MRSLFAFPNPVNEVSARLVAAGVVVMTAVLLAFGQHWLLIPLAYGFVARVLTGPTLSPLGQLVTRGITPRLHRDKPVPGPPKRFAQGIGATLTVTATILYFGFGWTVAADVFVAMVLVAATLESVFAYCLGCKLFAILMRAGIIPEDVCEQCNNIWSRTAAA